MTDKRKKVVRTPTSGWHEIASGDIGDMLYWQPGYEQLEHAAGVISLLDRLPEQQIDWARLINGLPRFAFLPDLFSRQTFSFQAWDEVDGFHVIEDESEDVGSMSGWFTHMRLTMDHDRKQEIFCSFETLRKRLEAYPPLRPHLDL
jgi:hypothetical protein